MQEYEDAYEEAQVKETAEELSERFEREARRFPRNISLEEEG